ncbi:topoisomerase DNA-binding C4 zinc finger domain-containing protein [Thalassotalea ponticola]|uniref:DNA topoisomerase family protein n=1 Tax=Thalassotalea ponticola TaxID=1523392 RepID=UPI0025B2FE58|nr:topoisomerase DNA-binding C4 zinc finger domain-containing protein [Thalassotalea ponticola]MDN3653045.1 topoisomerase DNA-binding C4 zinc finger domain-containing protein [Thalassotalea ponticola]
MSKENKPLFNKHEHALEKEFEVCPQCGSELQIKNSKAGAFIGCVSYPSCHYTRPLVEQEKFEQQVLPGTQCPQCKSELAVKQGRFGLFIGCTNFPQCHHIEQQQSEQLHDISCPACKRGHLVERHSRFGKTFYACDTYPKCKFAVNHEPVAGKCEKCGYALLVKRQMAAGERVQCADKKCAHFQTQ